MSIASVFPVILCGGSGTRLWPSSRKSYPKQFAPLFGERSLFQQCVARTARLGCARPLVVTSGAFRFIAAEQLAEIEADALDILVEPEGRNTAPAVLAAALHIYKQAPEGMLLVAPSDHIMPDQAALDAAIGAGLAAAGEGRLVTFGITPDRAETGYGYLELDGPPGEAAQPLVRFVEKPDAARAAEMIAAGNFLWNAGIFLFRADAIIAAFEAHAPGLVAPTRAALAKARPDLGLLRLDAEAWAENEDISIDYAVMEKAERLSVVPYHGQWSDLGAWDAVLAASETDAAGVALSGPAVSVECENTLLRAEAPNQRLVGLGLKNIAAIAMPDAVLVADLDAAQDVKAVVKRLKAEGAAQAESFPLQHRPWGYFESLVMGERFQVKRIVVHAGGTLSLQSHHHRAEHWIVVEGTASVTINGEEQLVTENQSVYIPLGAVHRLENPGKVPMVLIEVQTGAYLGEDDIIRYDDIYART